MTRDERGFTLIETLVAVTVMGVIVGAITTALMLFFTTTQDTTDRLAESPEAQIASTYLTRDAQSVQVTTSRCAQSSWPAGSTHLASFGRRDPMASTDPTDDRAVIASYVVSTASGSTQKQLRRYECTDDTVFDTPGAAFPTSLATASDATIVIAYVDPSAATTITTSATSTTASLSICTAKTATAECRNGTTLPFELTVARRVP